VAGPWFSTGIWFPPPIKTNRHDITEILLKVALNTIKQTTKKMIYYVISDTRYLTTSVG
jgi:hypothetical protein